MSTCTKGNSFGWKREGNLDREGSVWVASLRIWSFPIREKKCKAFQKEGTVCDRHRERKQFACLVIGEMLPFLISLRKWGKIRCVWFRDEQISEIFRGVLIKIMSVDRRLSSPSNQRPLAELCLWCTLHYHIPVEDGEVWRAMGGCATSEGLECHPEMPDSGLVWMSLTGCRDILDHCATTLPAV